MFGAPTNTTFAPGAMVWTASTSRVSSPYQPCGSWRGFSGRRYVPGETTCVNWPAVHAGSPWFAKYVVVSVTMVGDAYASIIATVTPRPSVPLAIALATPYAL